MSRARLQPIVDRYAARLVSAPMALMEMLLQVADADAVAAALPTLRASAPDLEALASLAREHAAGCARIAAMLQRGLDSAEAPATAEDGIERARRLFDDSVAQNEEASVALYSLGSPTLLAEATAEAVAVLEAWGVLGPDRDALEIGSGIGRFLAPLATRLRSIVGTDVSAGMTEAARRRTAGIPNVRLETVSGRDLSTCKSASLDLVYSIDAFPYVVLAGRELAATHFREAARVLRSGGDFVLFGYAYHRPRDVDAAEVLDLAAAAGLGVVRSDETPFRLWNAVAYHLRQSR